MCDKHIRKRSLKIAYLYSKCWCDWKRHTNTERGSHSSHLDKFPCDNYDNHAPAVSVFIFWGAYKNTCIMRQFQIQCHALYSWYDVSSFNFNSTHHTHSRWNNDFHLLKNSALKSNGCHVWLFIPKQNERTWMFFGWLKWHRPEMDEERKKTWEIHKPSRLWIKKPQNENLNLWGCAHSLSLWWGACEFCTSLLLLSIDIISRKPQLHTFRFEFYEKDKWNFGIYIPLFSYSKSFYIIHERAFDLCFVCKSTHRERKKME